MLLIMIGDSHPGYNAQGWRSALKRKCAIMLSSDGLLNTSCQIRQSSRIKTSISFLDFSSAAVCLAPLQI